MARLFLALVALFGLGACAASENTPRAPTARARSAPPTFTTIPYAESVLCGEVTVVAKPPRLVSDRAAARRAFDCLERAFKTCGAATLTVREQDTPIRRQFGVGFIRACDLVQAYQADSNAPPIFVNCGLLQKRVSGLFIGNCAQLGDYFIPSQ